MSSQRERLASTLIVLVASTVATFIGLLWVTSMAMAVPITLQGTFTEALGAANGRSYEITNMTGQSMSDLTASIQKDGGGDPGAKIKNIAITGGFQNDFEQAASPALPGSVGKVVRKPDGSRVGNGSQVSFDITLNLTNMTNGNWRVTLQPTDAAGNAIGKGLAANFTGTNQYQVTLTDEEVLANPFNGLAFNDVNFSSQDLTALLLSGNGFAITNAFQKDDLGDTIPGSSFSNGVLRFGEPVGTGQSFFIDASVDQFFAGTMTITASAVPEPGTLGVLAVSFLGVLGYTKRDRLRRWYDAWHVRSNHKGSCDEAL